MQAKLHCLTKKLIREENGQTIMVFSLVLIVMLAAAGLVVDIGHAMVVNNELKSTTIAAALAGANAMPNSDYATVAMDYSSCTAPPTGSKITTGCTVNENNAISSLGTVTTAATGYCSSFVSKSLNITCTNMGSGSVNALVVTQSVTMPTTFMRIFGVPSLTFSDSQTAAWKGAARNPYNVAVIVDSTESMTSEDSGSDGCSDQSAIGCALTGVQNLLEKLTPCSGGSTCGSTSPLDEVALYTFPGVSNASAATDDAECNAQISAASSTTGGFGINDSTTEYGFPGSTFAGTALTPNPPVYQIVGFSSDYKTNDANSTLNTNSELVEAAGGNGTCSYDSTSSKGGGGGGSNSSRGGIQDVGGAGTYYAGILYQAQTDLYNQYESRLSAGTQTSNVMVVLSDGDASATDVQVGGCKTYYTSGSKNGQCETTEDNTNKSGTYPSYEDECQQAVTAAQAATDGTWPTGSGGQSSSSPVKTTVYTVAYGSETTGCSEMPPCTTMQEMASSYLTDSSDPQLDFYSDYLDTATGGADQSCTSTNGVTNIPDIFQDIAATLSASKIMQTPATCSASNTSACD